MIDGRTYQVELAEAKSADRAKCLADSQLGLYGGLSLLKVAIHGMRDAMVATECVTRHWCSDLQTTCGKDDIFYQLYQVSTGRSSSRF